MSRRAEGIRTIVVDDSAAALRALCSIVERQKNLRLVGAAGSGRRALALARSLQPELVLVDLQMPVMDGLDVTSCLGRDCPTARVVIVTVHDSPGLRELCHARGACGFLRKGVLKDDLPVAVLKLFGDGAVRSLSPND